MRIRGAAMALQCRVS